MKQNRKGFTLIELLAVIVILAIIALIATPIILNMINQARKSAAKSAALGYIESVEYAIGLADVTGVSYNEKFDGMVLTVPRKKFAATTAIYVGDNVWSVEDLEEAGLKVKGKRPASGYIGIYKRKVAAANLCISNYLVQYTSTKKDADPARKCSDEELEGTTEDMKSITVGDNTVDVTAAVPSTSEAPTHAPSPSA